VFKKNQSLIISVLLHLIVIYVVAQSVMFPAVTDAPPKKQNVIQATLIFDTPPLTPETAVEEMEEETLQPVEPEAALPDIETPADNQIEPISEPEVPAIPISPIPEVVSPKREEEVQQEPEQNDDVNDTPLTEKTFTPTPSFEIGAPATNMARRHLNSFQQQQRNKVAEQASRYYQQHKNSPVIDNKVKNPFMTEDEQLRDSLQVRADCSSTTQKTTAVLLGFLGGQIDCSKPPPINSFIQDRINKTSLLPEQYRQEEQNRPQSIVIKE